MKNAIKVLCFVLAIILIGVTAFFFVYKWQKSDFEIEDASEKGTATIVEYLGKSKKIVIPDKIRGKKIVSIGNGAFQEKDITYVKLGKYVKSLDNNCFCDCKKLESIDLGHVQSIGNACFVNCTSLKSVTFPKEFELYGETPFGNDKALKEVKFESDEHFKLIDGVLYSSDMTEIVDTMPYASLTSFTCPDSVTSIAKFAFYGQEKLSSFTFGKNVKMIPEAMFAGCKALTTLDLPNNIVGIGSLVFSNSGIKTITIPKSVVNIDKTAFYNVDKQVTIKAFEKSTAYNYAKENEIKCEIIK